MSQRQVLLDYMRFLSMKHFGCAWQDGLEFFLWNCIETGSRLDGMDLYDLERLAFKLDGWFTWDEKRGEPAFVSLAEWLAIYEDDEANGDAYDEERHFG